MGMGKIEIKKGNNYNEEDMRGQSCSGVNLRSMRSLMNDGSIFLRIMGSEGSTFTCVDLLSG